MEAEVLKIVGQVAGIGGIALGAFLLLFRDIIRKNLFPRLSSVEAYKLLRLITGAIWSVALVGISAWVIVTIWAFPTPPPSAQQTLSIQGDHNQGMQVITVEKADDDSDKSESQKKIEGVGNQIVQEQIR